MNDQTRIHEAPPSALAYMLDAFRPSPGWNAARGFPDIAHCWRNFRIEPEALDDIARITGVERSAPALMLLYPHITGFRLSMAMLTCADWPLPIWGALQIRNRLRMHQMPHRGDHCTLNCRATAWRVLEKGLEVDLHTQLLAGNSCAWESVVTFYYRGRFGAASEHGEAAGAPALSPAIDTLAPIGPDWKASGGDRWRFGALTGDYNGIHQWDFYARRFGFPGAFAHPQRIAAMCLARLAPPSPPGGAGMQLDLWLKGPVHYGSELSLHATVMDSAVRFALGPSGGQRAALVGEWTNGRAAFRF